MRLLLPAALPCLLLAALGTTAPAQELHLFARGPDGPVLHATAPGQWAALGAQSIGAPDAAGAGFAVRGMDDALWWVPLDGAPERVEATLRSGPGAAWHPAHGLAVAAVGADGAAGLIVRVGGKWGQWQSLGGAFHEGAAPDLAWAAEGRLEIVARGMDDAAWRGSFADAAWSGWAPTGARLRGDPAIVSAPGGSFDLLHIGDDAQAHHGHAPDAKGVPIGGEFPRGGGIDACSDGRGGMAAVARGMDGGGWVNRWDGAAWSGWASWGGALDSDVTCSFVSDEPGAPGNAPRPDAEPEPGPGKDPWSDPTALSQALVRWAEPIGSESLKAVGDLVKLAPGLAFDADLLAAHVVRPKGAGLVTIASPDLRGAEIVTDGRGAELDQLAYRQGAIAALAGAAGYFLELRQRGEPIVTLQRNWARPPSGSSPGLDWTGSRRMHVASVSKLVTAMAMMRLLEQRGLSLDDAIGPYLPTSWARGSGVDGLTFRELLTHRSGLRPPAPFQADESSHPAMRGAIAAGSSGTTVSAYRNVNYGLCRVLMPIVVGTIDRERAFGARSLLPSLSDAIWDGIASQAYMQHVQANVLGPAGVTGATIGRVTDDALAQPLPPTGSGWESDDPDTLFYMTGTAGWHFSPHELLQVMATFRRGESIVSPESAQAMLEAGIGVDLLTRTRAGLVATKSGYWETAAGCEQAVASFLPYDMELVVFVNSRTAPGSAGGTLPATMDALYASSLRLR